MKGFIYEMYEDVSVTQHYKMEINQGYADDINKWLVEKFTTNCVEYSTNPSMTIPQVTVDDIYAISRYETPAFDTVYHFNNTYNDYVFTNSVADYVREWLDEDIWDNYYDEECNDSYGTDYSYTPIEEEEQDGSNANNK